MALKRLQNVKLLFNRCDGHRQRQYRLRWRLHRLGHYSRLLRGVPVPFISANMIGERRMVKRPPLALENDQLKALTSDRTVWSSLDNRTPQDITLSLQLTHLASDVTEFVSQSIEGFGGARFGINHARTITN